VFHIEDKVFQKVLPTKGIRRLNCKLN